MQIIDDFKEISVISEPILIGLIDEFCTNPLNTIGTIYKLEKKCSDENVDINTAKKFFSLLTFVCDYAIENKSFETGLKKVEEKIIQVFPSETEKVWNIIKNNFSKLEQFVIRRKEIQLAELTDRIKKFSIICDVRPVFNVERDKVEKYTFPLILSISTENRDNKLIVEFDEEMLEKIKREIDFALNKVKLLKDTIKIA